VKSALFQHARDGRHGGTGDSEQMDVLGNPIYFR
jgi:hypothetical protein